MSDGMIARNSSIARHACECCDRCVAGCGEFPDDEHIAACTIEHLED